MQLYKIVVQLCNLLELYSIKTDVGRRDLPLPLFLLLLFFLLLLLLLLLLIVSGGGSGSRRCGGAGAGAATGIADW